jgi:hypothetical protein
MRLQQLLDHIRPSWNHGKHVQVRMGSVIMGLDMLHVGRFSDALHLVDLSDIVVKVWVVTDACLVGLEIDNIDLKNVTFKKQEEEY